jgi:hypothetical protein
MMKIELQHTIYPRNMSDHFFVTIDGELTSATVTYEQDETVDCRKYMIELDRPE